jgi:CheY-like chemotaxis protein
VRRVLFVDDEAVLRRLVARMLERLGVPYDALEDGSEVAGALRPEHDLILLDIVMKHSDGVQVRALRVLAARITASMALLLFMIFDSFRAQICEALRASCVTIPIVAMTGNVDPTSIRVFKRSGFDGLLAKPFTQASAAAAGCARLLS